KKGLMEEIKRLLEETRVNPSASVNNSLSLLNALEIKKSTTLKELLRRPGMKLDTVLSLSGHNIAVPHDIACQIETETRYEGYIKRQNEEAGRFKRTESLKIPARIAYDEVSGLSNEIKEKLKKAAPESMGQASRLSGVTPAAISMLMVHLKKIGAI
ncbi:MAG: tRNA uridine-5-carboxymethylaminomethyl(34) synthesis enzyme MnmG, partial [Deltaproteobacteria bacterium]|nr:tRNA uridine-5-carboxymethylaminomethyl(34) synthesis enzyme MnmG [Deltaproteobacteria bacterium]